MAPREDDGPAEPPGATEPVQHRVARLADIGEAGPTAPVLSFQGIEADGEQTSVVDLGSWRRVAPEVAPVVPLDRPGASLPPARVVEIRPAGRAGQRRTSAPRAEAGSVAEPEGALREPGPTGPATTERGSGARERGFGRSRSSTGQRSAQRGVDRQPSDIKPEIDADPVAVAREICLRLLTERACTRQELAQALTKRGVPDEAAVVVLERFDEVGLIDDAAFAGQWVRSRHTGRGLARRAIAFELRRKGVADEVAQEALAEVDANSEEQRARELVERKLRTIPADTPQQREAAARRLVGMLARKGYPGGTAYRVVREALAAHGADIDELGSGPDD